MMNKTYEKEGKKGRHLQKIYPIKPMAAVVC